VRVTQRIVLTGIICLIVGYAVGACVGYNNAVEAATCKTVRSGTNLQSALNAAGTGAHICLVGTFYATSEVRPLQGQTISGGVLKGRNGADVGFAMRTDHITLNGVEVSGFVKGIVCGPNGTILDSYVHDNSMVGIVCIAQHADYHLLIRGNRLIHNGSNKWEYIGASGMKLMEMSRPGHCLTCGAMVINNIANDNDSNGLWLDRTSSGVTIADNTTNGNTHKGIRCEKCAGPILIEGNTATDNFHENISVVNSAVVTLRNNRTARSKQNTGLRVDYSAVARKSYPNIGDDSLGYHAKSIQVFDKKLYQQGVKGCEYANVTCK